MSTVKIDNIKNPRNSNNSLTIDSSGRVFSTTVRPSFLALGVLNTGQGSRNVRFGTTIPFNRGDVYNSTTGFFTCPIDGFYHFNCHIFAYNTSAARFLSHFYRNSTIIAECTTEQPTAGQGSGYGSLGISINLELNSGDTVFLATTAGVLGVDVPYGHFSGFFVG